MSAPSSKQALFSLLDRLSLLGMAWSVGLMLQPWWSGGLRAGFILTAGFTLLQIFASHALSKASA